MLPLNQHIIFDLMFMHSSNDIVFGLLSIFSSLVPVDQQILNDMEEWDGSLHDAFSLNEKGAIFFYLLLCCHFCNFASILNLSRLN